VRWARSSAKGVLREIPGIGEPLAAIVTRLHETGTHLGQEAMRKRFRPAFWKCSTSRPRPEKVIKLYKKRGITSLAALEQAAKDDRPKGMKGLWPALQTKILQGIAIGRRLLRSAEQRLRQAHPDLNRITPAGDTAAAASWYPTSP
jgi:DNA polymerase (family 10)